MCGSVVDSVSAGTIIYGVGIILILSGKPEYLWLGSFILIIGTMQFVDALLWIMKQHNMSTDFVSRYLIVLILVLEPIIAYLGYVYFYKQRIPLFEIVLFTYTVSSIYIWTTICDETTITQDGYLKWCGVDILFINKVIFLFILLFPILFFPNMLQKVLCIGIITGTWLYNLNHEAFGSRWCYSTVAYSIMVLGTFLLYP
jgi:hypothetical protein